MFNVPTPLVRSPRGHDGRRARTASIAVGAALAASAIAAAARAVALSPQSPEVLALVDKGLRYLEKQNDDRLGGKCLVALAFHKRGMPNDHPRIREALDACRQSKTEMQQETRIYSKAIALIFLVEVAEDDERELIGDYAALMQTHQMPHGGYGYMLPGEALGDTSQTQYAVLAYWEMLQAGVSPKVEDVERCANWILRTQSPEGAWAYKGQDPGTFKAIEQAPSSTCLLSAGASSLLICGNVLGLVKPAGSGPAEEVAGGAVGGSATPAALKLVEQKQLRAIPVLRSTGAVDTARITKAAASARQWLDKNFDVTNGGYYAHYALYALERYKSFEEFLTGEVPEEPQWYRRGYEFLKSSQQDDGSWRSYADSSTATSTAFSVLFLLRSTQASIKARLGEGTLVGGRGLPSDLSKVRLRGGRIVVQQKLTDLDKLLEMLEESEDESPDEFADQLPELSADQIDPQQARRFEQLLRTGKPGERRLAAAALGRLRSVDYAPALIFALTDPDRRVVREARDALQSISRNFEGFGPEDNFDEPARRDAIERWKAWYGEIRPDAPPLP
jgi:uncharacterized protein (DUF433 family)